MAIRNSTAAGSSAVNQAANQRLSETMNANQAKKAAGNAYGKAAKAGNSAAEVSISPRAREMSIATKAVKDTPDVREDKVAHFKQMIANGEYKVDAGKVADGMMREAIKDELASNPEVALED